MKQLIKCILVTVIFLYSMPLNSSIIKKPSISLGYSISYFNEIALNKDHIVNRYQNFLIEHKEGLKKIPVKYRMHVAELCFIYDVPIALVYNIVYHESRWKSHIISKKNSNGSYDIGLMQLNSKYINYYVNKFYEDKNFNPLNGYQNLELGIKYLAYLHNKLEGEWYRVAIAYNYGINRVNHKLPKQVKLYAERIVSF